MVRVWVQSSCHLSPQVIVTVPLSLLKRGAIVFAPPLSDRKLKAINNLGAGLVEKVTFVDFLSVSF